MSSKNPSLQDQICIDALICTESHQYLKDSALALPPTLLSDVFTGRLLCAVLWQVQEKEKVGKIKLWAGERKQRKSNMPTKLLTERNEFILIRDKKYKHTCYELLFPIYVTEEKGN